MASEEVSLLFGAGFSQFVSQDQSETSIVILDFKSLKRKVPLQDL
jgi:hypothetical protein